MQKISLKYGCNPNQVPSDISFPDGALTVLNGRPGYINFMDALNGWQLVRDLRVATGKSAATSFKHVSPAGAAVSGNLTDTERAIYQCDLTEVSDVASAYIRARGADRMSSYGDFAALSDACDESTALFLKNLVSDGVIAPSYTDKALEILKGKRKGGYNIIQIDPNYVPDSTEIRTIFGVTFTQGRNDIAITDEALSNIVTKNKALPENAATDLKIAMITLKYTQSNSVCYVKNGSAIGIGAGQQSRIHCTRLAGQKADNWFLRQSPRALDLLAKLKSEDNKPADIDNAIDVFVTEENDIFTNAEKRDWLTKLTGVSLGSDAFFPFGDNIERAVRSGVSYIAQPGGSIRDDNVIEACDKYGIVMAFNGIRLFHH
jgi:AICAR transformylase/IMP cyclohydrolase PurH